MRKFILALVIMLSPLSAVPAFSCVCVLPANPTPESIRAERRKAFDDAVTVFTGEIVEQDFYKVRFKVDKLWKGEPLDEITMMTGVKDNGDGTATRSSCDFGYTRGRKYLIYAYGKPDALFTHVCSRSRLIDEHAAEEIRGLDEIGPHETRNREKQQ